MDHRVLIEGTMLAIETDENKHSSYNKQDEINRYHDLFMVHTGKWIFIRFNPNTSYNINKHEKRNPKLKSSPNVLSCVI